MHLPANPHLPALLVAVVFFSFYKEGGQRKLAAQLDWVLLCSVAVLPAVGFLLIAYLRRERALGDLARGERWGLPCLYCFPLTRDSSVQTNMQTSRCRRALQASHWAGERARAPSARFPGRCRPAPTPLPMPARLSIAPPCCAVKVLMLALYSSHRDWVPEGQRPAGHLEGVQASGQRAASRGASGASRLRRSAALAACLPQPHALPQLLRPTSPPPPTPHPPRSAPCVHPAEQASLAAVLHGLRAYLSPMRFYSRYYPYMGSKAAMVHIALERTRKVGRAGQRCAGGGGACVLCHLANLESRGVEKGKAGSWTGGREREREHDLSGGGEVAGMQWQGGVSLPLLGRGLPSCPRSPAQAHPPSASALLCRQHPPPSLLQMRRVSGGIYGLQAAATSLHGCSMPQALLPQVQCREWGAVQRVGCSAASGVCRCRSTALVTRCSGACRHAGACSLTCHAALAVRPAAAQPTAVLIVLQPTGENGGAPWPPACLGCPCQRCCSPLRPLPSPAQLHNHALELQLAVERLAAVKEFRTPQVGAAARRLACCRALRGGTRGVHMGRAPSCVCPALAAHRPRPTRPLLLPTPPHAGRARAVALLPPPLSSHLLWPLLGLGGKLHQLRLRLLLLHPGKRGCRVAGMALWGGTPLGTGEQQECGRQHGGHQSGACCWVGVRAAAALLPAACTALALSPRWPLISCCCSCK